MPCYKSNESIKTITCYKSGNNDDKSNNNNKFNNNDKSDNNEDKVCLLLRR